MKRSLAAPTVASSVWVGATLCSVCRRMYQSSVSRVSGLSRKPLAWVPSGLMKSPPLDQT
jgi:hypothetical protein